MFKRKIEQDLQNWFNNLSNRKEAFIIRGLRQIGKTTTAKYFAEEHFDNVVYINFLLEKSVKTFFDGDLNVDYIIRMLSAYNLKFNFVPNKTVIIFDEIQECPNARTAIKSFMLDGRFAIIATGSLMGLKGYNDQQPSSIPVGFENNVVMKAMDFEEFMWAKGVKLETIDIIKDCFNKMIKVPDPINSIFMEYFKEYICVGGMPSAVKEYIDTNNFGKVRKVLERILTSYQDDFGKHLNAEGNRYESKIELHRIQDVYKSIPVQLAKENKKFMYSEIKKNAKGREYLGAVIWLEEYGLINRCYRLNNISLPLKGNYDEGAFKVYVADTGLFLAMLDSSIYLSIMSNDLGLYKGAIYENIIAESFAKNDNDLFYYSKTNGNEIDFVTTNKAKPTLIEVKAANNASKSLTNILKNNPEFNNYKLIYGNVGTANNINTLPLYMAFLIKDNFMF